MPNPSNLYTFYRRQPARAQKFLLAVEDYRRGEPRPSVPSPKLSVIQRLAAEGRKNIVIPENLDLEA